MKQTIQEHLSEPVLAYSHTDFPVLNWNWTVREAIERIRKQNIGERLIYFYLVDDNGRLVGIVPTRRLLSAEPDLMVRDIGQNDVIALPHTASVREACELFANHKYLAFPIVDQEQHLIGVVDIGFFNAEQLSFTERQQIEDAFQLIGFGLSEVSDKSPLAAFRYRFPWLLATIAGGTLCAVLAGAYEVTLQKMIILAFFLTLVLGLAESVSMQSMTVVIQRFHVVGPTWRAYIRWLKTEFAASLCLGLAAGLLVGSIALLWRGDAISSLVIGGSICLSIISASFLGLSIPTLLHAIHEDSKIAAGPVTLALTDLTTLVLYLNAAAVATK